MKTSIKMRLLLLTMVPILAILALSVGKVIFDIKEKESLLASKSRILRGGGSLKSDSLSPN